MQQAFKKISNKNAVMQPINCIVYTCIKLHSAFQNFSITPEPEIKQVPINLDSDVITLWDVIFYISCKNDSTFYLLVTHIVEIIKVIIVV